MESGYLEKKIMEISGRKRNSPKENEIEKQLKKMKRKPIKRIEKKEKKTNKNN